MKEITQEEFIDRSLAFMRANKILVETGVMTNLNLAFEMYQKIFAERERDIFVSDPKWRVTKGGKIFDKYIRPRCPDCGEELMFQSVPKNDDGIWTRLVCSNDRCDLVLNSEHDINWWMDKLAKRI